MWTMTGTRRRTAAFLALVVGAALAVPARAADDLRMKALALNDVTGANPIKGQVLTLTEDPAGTKKLLAVAKGMTKEKPQPFSVNATLILASAAADLKDYGAGETFYRLHAEQAIKLLSGEGVAEAYLGLIQIYSASKQFTKAETACREFLGVEVSDKDKESINRFKGPVIRRLILILARQGKFKNANQILDEMIKAQPDNWLTLELKGRVQREEGKLDDALRTYQSVIDKVQNDKRLEKSEKDDFVNDYRYALSGLYVDLNQVDKAAEVLKALLAKDPNNPTYNNDLGFIWADHDMNLAESEKLVRKALEEDRKQRLKANPSLKPSDVKDNAAYLDSLAWVLYKQKKYKEAKPYLEQAVREEEGKHLEIYDHLGDVLMALGEKTEAIAAWKAGIKAASSSPREKKRAAEVEKKIDKANK